jgi:hypothetical protein
LLGFALFVRNAYTCSKLEVVDGEGVHYFAWLTGGSRLFKITNW